MRFLICLLFLSHVAIAKDLETKNATMVFKLNKDAKVGLGKNSKVKIIDASTIELVRGHLRLKSSKNYRVVAPLVTFTTEKGEFETAILSKSEVELNVYVGEVEASSPLIQTFVPEIIKAKEGFVFSSKKKTYTRKKFSPKLNKLTFQ